LKVFQLAENISQLGAEKRFESDVVLQNQNPRQVFINHLKLCVNIFTLDEKNSISFYLFPSVVMAEEAADFAHCEWSEIKTAFFTNQLIVLNPHCVDGELKGKYRRRLWSVNPKGI